MPISKFESMIALALQFLEEGDAHSAVVTLTSIQLLIHNPALEHAN